MIVRLSLCTALCALACCRDFTPRALDGHLVGRARAERYEAPDYACVRKAGSDLRAMPKTAAMPGEPAVFTIVFPAGGTKVDAPLVFMPHGDSFEFIEEIATRTIQRLRLEDDPQALFATLGTPEQSTRASAEERIATTESSAIAKALVATGAALVIPGNCWGDGGHGVGERAASFYTAQRFGGTFDAKVWQYAREQVIHAADREWAVVCSGGGRRAIELVQRDPSAFDAIVLDSPADDVTAFLEAPRPESLAIAGVAMDDAAIGAVFERFWTGIYGGKAKAYASSLADDLDGGRLRTPIYLAYSTNDPIVTAPVTRRLVEAMARAASATRRTAVFDEKRHCQLQDDAAIQPALEWLTSVGR
ncbi:MAG: hypothetical protein IT381_25375 [Deltaproteobacteria bacterium]|nr:hypothetical protein [Deltaproteobacteria bacterium]